MFNPCLGELSQLTNLHCGDGLKPATDQRRKYEKIVRESTKWSRAFQLCTLHVSTQADLDVDYHHWIRILHWLVVWNMNFIFHILGISSSQLTNLFQRGWNHQPENDGTTCRDMMECWNQGWKHAYLAYFLIFCFTLCGFSDILSEKGFIRNVIWDSVRAAQRARELGAGRKKRQTYLAGGKKAGK